MPRAVLTTGGSQSQGRSGSLGTEFCGAGQGGQLDPGLVPQPLSSVQLPPRRPRRLLRAARRSGGPVTQGIVPITPPMEALPAAVPGRGMGLFAYASVRRFWASKERSQMLNSHTGVRYRCDSSVPCTWNVRCVTRRAKWESPGWFCSGRGSGFSRCLFPSYWQGVFFSNSHRASFRIGSPFYFWFFKLGAKLPGQPLVPSAALPVSLCSADATAPLQARLC